MKTNSIGIYALLLLVVISVLSCLEITPIKPPEYTSICKAPSLEKNIVGKWQYKSTYNLVSTTQTPVVTEGTISFNVDGTMTDPDSLFENHPNGKLTIRKTYLIKPVDKMNDSNNQMMWVMQDIKGSFGQQINFFTLVSNECNSIRFLHNKNEKIGFTLTRL